MCRWHCLAILLASLMTSETSGNGFELTAMKASGISLIKSMRPLIVFIILVAIGAFFFQNYVLPVAQTKMWTLLYSVRQKSPELEFPKGCSTTRFPATTSMSKRKTAKAALSTTMMIYDVSRGLKTHASSWADSGHLKLADDKEHLFLQLHSGEQFENCAKTAPEAVAKPTIPPRIVQAERNPAGIRCQLQPHGIESGMRNQYVGKNIAELQATIDSVSEKVDSIGAIYAKELKESPYLRIPYYRDRVVDNQRVQEPQQPVAIERTYACRFNLLQKRPGMTPHILPSPAESPAGEAGL